ncbi:hypothetical protein RIF29_00760 [Crotalaria pallida]|uniref:Uncharacterized protein n=1 Tax=Crotalaria pallida TaxID=3830 RepID=A0AAN9P6S2_CROPI
MSTPISSVPKNLDLEQLDDDDFEDIDALSPKKAASIMKKLDLLRSRIKGKVIEGDKAVSPIAANTIDAMSTQPDTIEKEASPKKASAVNEVIQNQCVEVSVVNETQMESGEVQILEEDHSRKEQQEGSWTPPMLRELNKRKFKDIDTKESQARTKLDTIQDLLQTDPSNIHLQKLEKEARMDHAEVYKAAIMFLKQKAKQEWLCEDGYDYLIGDVPAFPFYRTV